jgi:hypothetical protein
MEEHRREYQSELKGHAVEELELNFAVNVNTNAEEHLNSENEHSFPENVELVTLSHLMLLLLVSHEGEVGQAVCAARNGQGLALLGGLTLFEGQLLPNLRAVHVVETLFLDLLNN